jgi:hypothetical protein
MATFHDSDSIVKEWPEAASIDSAQLQDLLDIAAEQCMVYAPLATGVTEADVPDRYRLAQKLHAQALWRMGESSGDDGGDGLPDYRVTVYPMDTKIRRILRPLRGLPVLG